MMVIHWLEMRSQNPDGRPWVLFVSFIAPHFPLIVPKHFYDLYDLDLLPPIKRSNPELLNHPWWVAFNNCYTFDRYFKDDSHRKIATSALGLLFLCSRRIALFTCLSISMWRIVRG